MIIVRVSGFNAESMTQRRIDSAKRNEENLVVVVVGDERHQTDGCQIPRAHVFTRIRKKNNI